MTCRELINPPSVPPSLRLPLAPSVSLPPSPSLCLPLPSFVSLFLPSSPSPFLRLPLSLCYSESSHDSKVSFHSVHVIAR